MRPLRLEMSAFGSYGSVEIVDFTQMNQGLFLVTGDTGSGKTTIFDGIMYALYDQTSGGRRDGSMMRSQYADGETPTYVELEFIYRGDTYRIRRNPEYYRQSRRRRSDGKYPLVKTAPMVELYLPDGSLFPGKKREVDKKIVEIIGLDADQFRQVAMIAQGDFLRLLHAGSKERKEIFSRIFHTRIHWLIQENLKNKAKSYYGQLEDLTRLCRREMDTVHLVEDSAYEEAWEQAKEASAFHLEEIVEVLGCVAEESKAHVTQAAAEKKDVQERLIQWEELLRREENRQAAEKKLGHNRQQLAQVNVWIETNSPVLEEKRGAMEQAQQDLSSRERELSEVITRLTDSLKQYEALARCEKERHALECAISIAEMQLRRSELKELEVAYEELDERRRAEEAQKKKLKKAQQQVQQVTTEYNELYERFFREQAGILAQALEEGKPCPVCGSVAHPHKAVLSEQAPTQQQVEQAKKKRERAENLRDQEMLAYQKCRQLTQQREEGTEQLGRKILALKNFKADDTGRERLAKAYGKIDSREEKYLTKYEKVTGSRYSKPHNLSGSEQWSSHLQESRVRRATLIRESELLTEHLPHGSESQTRRQLLKCEKELAALKDTSRKAAVAYEKLSNQWNVKSGEKIALEKNRQLLAKEYEKAQKILEELLKKLVGLEMGEESAKRLPSEDTEDAQEKIVNAEQKETIGSEQEELVNGEQGGSAESRQKEIKEIRVLAADKRRELEAAIRRLEKTYLAAYTAYQKNREALLELQDYVQKQESLREQYLIYQDLSRTANGQLSGSVKLDFETYVQRQYFKQIIACANRRLVQMNNRQFILQCRDVDKLGNQGQVGLDLDVYHLVNNSTRDVKTLSGGESFMAALSMALGLADIIQNEAGAIRLDTMFVDEGFGSLDDESRAQAIQVLLELSGSDRLVGIISHVNELKEQIDEKLLVTKDEKGSHVKYKAG